MPLKTVPISATLVVYDHQETEDELIVAVPAISTRVIDSNQSLSDDRYLHIYRSEKGDFYLIDIETTRANLQSTIALPKNWRLATEKDNIDHWRIDIFQRSFD